MVGHEVDRFAELGVYGGVVLGDFMLADPSWLLEDGLEIIYPGIALFSREEFEEPTAKIKDLKALFGECFGLFL